MARALQAKSRPSDPRRVVLLRAALALLCLLAGDPARAASSLLFPAPTRFGEFPGETRDPDGAPIGPARVAVVRDAKGHVVLEGERGIAERESVSFYARLEPADGGDALRVITQRTRTLDAQGAVVGETVIDHASGQATCISGNRQETIQLPEGDRVANVPISLLLTPVASGEIEEIAFQALICDKRPRLLDVSARRTGRVVQPAGAGRAVEIEYEVRLGAILSRIARPFLPRILFWIDPADSGTSVAQQMPLYPMGPTIFIVRSGLAPELFLSR